MKVNMTPNPLDVVTIHASQGDTEAREWEFELHNNGELIDTSNVTEQMFFKAYKGGTEQLLPENTSAPTTTPIIAGIQYPQGLLNDQEFLYRESPSEEDGFAKFTSIKGNTIVWNQQNKDNYTDASKWSINGSFPMSVNNNVLTATVDSGSTPNSSSYIRQNPVFYMISGHKYLLKIELKSTKAIMVRFLYSGVASGTETMTLTADTWNTYTSVVTMTQPYSDALYINVNAQLAEGDSVQFRNYILVDLTLLNDSRVTDYDSFKALYPLPFYAFDSGSLLSFNGTGIKTVGKNQFDTQVITTSYQGLTLTKTQGTIRAVYSGGLQYAGFNFYGSPAFTDTFLKGKYRLSFDVKGLDTQWTVGLRQGASFLGGGQALAISNDGHYSFTIDAEANPNCYLSFARTGNKATAYDVTFSNIQLELGTTETSYTPFEEQTISLPISQYFPTGMKSAGNVYDELTESKAITRVGVVDLGTLRWYYSGGLFLAQISNGAYTGSSVGSANGKCASYEAKAVNPTSLTDKQMTLGTAYAFSNVGNVVIKDSSYSDATTFKTAMSGVYLYYELATPTETSFTTASLVTENAEIPLSNNDGVLIGKCTEQLSENPGFIDAKIKLSDSDGECYSNKIQLHVERSPQ